MSCPQTDNPGELTLQRLTGPAWPCFSRREGHAFSLMNDIPGSGNGVTFGVALPPQLTPEYPLYPLNTDPSPHRVSGRGFLPRPGSPPSPEGSPWACRSSGCGRQVHLWVSNQPSAIPEEAFCGRRKRMVWGRVLWDAARPGSSPHAHRPRPGLPCSCPWDFPPGIQNGAKLTP